MTEDPAIATRDAPSSPRSGGEVAVSLAHQMARDEFRRGDLAELRRMDPDGPDPAVFWRLMAAHDLLGNPVVESKWALILHGIALMTPSNPSGNSRIAHDGQMPVGRALFLGGGAQRSAPFYSENRLNRLLTARGPMLRTLMARMFRMHASANVSFNWREMALFVLNEGYDDAAAEQGRRRIARDYYQAERRNAPADSK